MHVFSFEIHIHDVAKVTLHNARCVMCFFLFAICESDVIDFMTTTADAFGKRDIGILHKAVKLGVVEFVVFVKRIDLLHVDDPNALVYGVFNAVLRHPAASTGIENTKSKDEAKAKS